jgi:hypothetical protein
MEALMKVSRPVSAIGSKKTSTRSSESPRLPHETDQAPDSQQEDPPRRVGEQAHRDVERGLEDTDRRGGDDYQKRTQNDTQVNRNSIEKRHGDGNRRRHGIR